MSFRWIRRIDRNPQAVPFLTVPFSSLMTFVKYAWHRFFAAAENHYVGKTNLEFSVFTCSMIISTPIEFVKTINTNLLLRSIVGNIQRIFKKLLLSTVMTRSLSICDDDHYFWWRSLILINSRSSVPSSCNGCTDDVKKK